MRGNPIVNAVVEARLSGQGLRPLAGRSLLGWVVRAALATPGVCRVVVATSDAGEDDAVAEEARWHGASAVRGSRDDVLARFLLAGELYPADAVLRLTTGSPLHDPALLGQLVALWKAQPGLDYLSNGLVRTLPQGLEAELVRTALLREQAAEPHGPHRDDVTALVRADPERYACSGVVVAPAADDLCLTAGNWRLLERVVAELGDRPIPWREVVGLLRSRPDLLDP